MGRRRGRPTETRDQFRHVLVVGDGESERVYFDRCNSLGGPARFEALGSGKTGIEAPLRMARRRIADQRKVGILFSEIAIVMDLDDRFDRNEVERFVKLCKDFSKEVGCPCTLYLSNPCFEVWLLWHRKDRVLGGSQRDMLEQMRAVFEGYDKAGGIEWDGAMQADAIRRAERAWGGRECTAIECMGLNPGTMVYLLFKPSAPKVR